MRLLTPFLLLSLMVAATQAPAAPVRGPAAPAAAAEPVAPPSEPVAPVTAPVAALRAELERLVGSGGWRGVDRWGVMVVSLDRGDTLYTHAGDALMTPASNLKLFTSAAALHYLGPQFRYNTFLLADGVVEGGELRGDLVLYGTGDPTLSGRFGNQMAVWRAFADTLKSLGVTRISGAVVGDGSYFAGPGTGAGWKEDYMNASYAAPAGALSYAENIATLEIRPASQAGWRPEIRLVPGGDGIAIVNQATTVTSGRSWVSVSRAAYDGPITVRGQIRRGTGPLQRSIPVSDPARYAAAVLREVLRENGVEVAGGVRSVQTEAESPVTGRSVFAPAYDGARPLRVLALHNSPPLIDILEIVNKRSHNLMSEQALRTVARVATGEGTVEGGARAVRHLLDEATPGSEVPTIAMYDGSGLSPLNRVSARTTIHLLSYMRKSPMWEAYWQTLPEVGGPGGLRRMYQTGAERNLRAKTGTIDNVSALSGYVRSGDGEMLAFSIMANDVPSTWRAKRIEDAIGARLAAFTRSGAVVAETSVRREQPAAKAGGRSYRIRKGDTLTGIAKRHRTTVAALERANPGLSPRRLIPGKTIRLP